MKTILTDVTVETIATEMQRRGIRPHQRVRVVVETSEDENLPITAINADSAAFAFLAEEDDLTPMPI